MENEQRGPSAAAVFAAASLLGGIAQEAWEQLEYLGPDCHLV